MSPTRVRPPAVSGRFYPGDPARLGADVDRYLTAGRLRLAESGGTVLTPPKAIIAPHAGYVYSGPIAGTAFARLVGRAEHIDRVVLLGPNHTVALRAMAVSSADRWRTPLGDVSVCAELRDAVEHLPGVVVDDVPHASEHSLEVQLPFLQRALPHPFELLPVVVGQVPAELVARLLDQVWGGPETLIVVSTDLSHYHDQRTAQSLDRCTADAICRLDTDTLAGDGACGFHPVSGLLLAARSHGLRPQLVDLRTSADTAGTPDRVVGYGSFVLSDPTTAELAEAGVPS
ncbi:MAG: AmmeMemoRadiSam system protein B [Acidimicrobiales bacterium]|nr:AmmeMemoRadiSam system protein B [Acidimicrobiales bacterium]